MCKTSNCNIADSLPTAYVVRWKVMFSDVSILLSTGGGGDWQGPPGPSPVGGGGGGSDQEPPDPTPPLPPQTMSHLWGEEIESGRSWSVP